MNEQQKAQFAPKLFFYTDWRTIEIEKPEYYDLNLCYGNNAMAVCWRASDGDKDIYTIAGTDNIMQNVSHWMPLPSAPVANKTDT